MRCDATAGGLIGCILVLLTVFFYSTKTGLFPKFFVDSHVQDIYLQKLGPYGTIGPLESYIKSNSVKYYPF